MYNYNGNLFSNLASPSAPKDFKVVEVSRHHVHLSWEAPEHDGGSPVTGYNIEKREVSRKTWVKVSTLEMFREYLIILCFSVFIIHELGQCIQYIINWHLRVYMEMYVHRLDTV